VIVYALAKRRAVKTLVPRAQPIGASHRRLGIARRSPRRGSLGLDLREHVGRSASSLPRALPASRRATRRTMRSRIASTSVLIGTQVHRESKALWVVDERAIGDDDMEMHVQVTSPPKRWTNMTAPVH
jgi:hypothetical protein